MPHAIVIERGFVGRAGVEVVVRRASHDRWSVDRGVGLSLAEAMASIVKATRYDEWPHLADSLTGMATYHEHRAGAA